FMIGLRRSFCLMMGDDRMSHTNYLCAMTSTHPPRDWTDIRRPELAGTDRVRWIAVLPLAATEQHGPHLPLETDVLIAQAYLALVREQLPDALPVTFLPVERIGISTEHTDFPGTLTLT